MTNSRKICLSNEDIFDIDKKFASIPAIDQKSFEFLKKISKTDRLINFAKCYQGEINLTFHKKYLSKDKNEYAPMIKGAAIQKWYIKDKMSQGDKEYLDKQQYLTTNTGEKSKHHKIRRIVMQGITGVDEFFRLKMHIIEPEIFCGHSVNYIIIKNSQINKHYLLSLLNSSLLNWFFKIFSTNSNVNCYEVDNLPIKRIEEAQQKPFRSVVESILSITKEYDYSKDAEKQSKIREYEKQIDQMVYKLYELTPEEIKIVENFTK
jgi:hypothetical protein